ncbi:MAG: hypothetical protein KDE22_15245 [Rhodobacterales bacterium]|nr:hypothetical protein [Rhodobacterales bacterium]
MAPASDDGEDDIRGLIARVDRVADRLMPNERDLFDEIRQRLSGNGGAPAFEDRACLEVMLRNVLIRAGKAPGRDKT